MTRGDFVLKVSNRFLKLSKMQTIGFVILFAMLLFAYLQPIYYPVDYTTQNLLQVLQKPSAQYWLGTDNFGRDMLARVASAIRLSFGMVVMSVSVSLIFGLFFGIVASLGGVYDKVLGFLCDIIMALPGLLFILLFAAIAPNSFWALYLGIALVMWVEFFKMTRAIAQTLAKSSEIEASRLMGLDFVYCIRRHYLPKILPMLLPLAAYGASNAVLALATLGFINVGLRPPTAELGLMMTELFPYYYDAPLIFLQPILATILLVLGFQLLSGQIK